MSVKSPGWVKVHAPWSNAIKVWFVILYIKALQRAIFQRIVSAHNNRAGAVIVIVLTSDSSPYNIWTVLFHSVKDNCIASISLGQP